MIESTLQHKANSDVTTMLVVYDHPKDFPAHFVVRAWYVGIDSCIQADQDAWLFQTLEDVHKAIPCWMTYMPRFEGDDPAILETWI